MIIDPECEAVTGSSFAVVLSLVLPRFDGHLMIAPSGRKGVRHVNKEPAEVHARVQRRGLEMVEAAGGNIAQVANELGIYDLTLGNWVRQAREHGAARRARRSAPRSTGRELERELERTRQKRDSLTRACIGERPTGVG